MRQRSTAASKLSLDGLPACSSNVRALCCQRSRPEIALSCSLARSARCAWRGLKCVAAAPPTCRFASWQRPRAWRTAPWRTSLCSDDVVSGASGPSAPRWRKTPLAEHLATWGRLGGGWCWCRMRQHETITSTVGRLTQLHPTVPWRRGGTALRPARSYSGPAWRVDSRHSYRSPGRRRWVGIKMSSVGVAGALSYACGNMATAESGRKQSKNACASC